MEIRIKRKRKNSEANTPALPPIYQSFWLPTPSHPHILQAIKHRENDLKKLMILIIVFFVNANTPAAVAADDEKKIDISISTTWSSKYVIWGYDVYQDKAAFIPAVTFDLYGSGFFAKLWGAMATSSGTKAAPIQSFREWDYILGYNGKICEDEPTQTDYTLMWVYTDIYKRSSDVYDLQDARLILAMPNLFDNGLVPTYRFHQRWAAKSNSAAKGKEGSLHEFGLKYPLYIEDMDKTLNLKWDITYNHNGYSNPTSKSGFSHTKIAASMNFKALGGTITPAIFFQDSMMDSVNKNDELWTSITYSTKF
jgi:hypothetical protein